ncbi:hypothetical protein [Paracoccus sp. T5]|uniref:hypothetical protein n=1 Tax=Paracoccus sp. T5 TaxID=3402161 RepID=UPI003AEF087E
MPALIMILERPKRRRDDMDKKKTMKSLKFCFSKEETSKSGCSGSNQPLPEPMAARI